MVLCGSVHSFCCAFLLFIFTVNTSFTRLSVTFPKLPSDARSLSSFQNCLNVSCFFCFRLRILNCSRVSFLGFAEQSLNVLIKSTRVILALFTVGNLSDMVFFAAIPNARQSALFFFHIRCFLHVSQETFFFGACSFCKFRKWNVVFGH